MKYVRLKKTINENTLSELHIEGYEFNSSNLFKPQLIIKDNKILCFTPNGVDIFEINEWSKKWLEQIKKNQGLFNVSYHNILELDIKMVKDGEIIPILDRNQKLELKCKILEEKIEIKRENINKEQ